MQTAEVKNVTLNKDTREIIATIHAKGSMYVQEPDGIGFPAFINSAPLVEGFNYVLEFGHIAVEKMKDNKDFTDLIEQNRKLRRHITKSNLADRVRQLLSALDYGQLSDFQAKCVLLVEQELKNK